MRSAWSFSITQLSLLWLTTNGTDNIACGLAHEEILTMLNGHLTNMFFCLNRLRNAIAYKYWAIRFSSQCVYYLLVVSAALLQIYHKNVGRGQMKLVFMVIIEIGAVFLWLELLQAIKNFKRYRR